MFLERAETWSPRDGRTFKNPAWTSVLVALVFTGGTLGLVHGALRGSLGWIGWAVAVPCFLLAWLIAKTARRALGPANWVMIVKHSGVALKVRSYLNSDLDARDRVVAWIPSDEIRAVRRVGGSRDVPDQKDGSSTRTDRVVSLDILLKRPDTRELAEAIRRERAFRGEGRMQFHHYPVSVPEPGCIRVGWNQQRQHLAPGIDAALALLGESYPVEAELEEGHQDWRTVEGADLDRLILELAEAGERLRAIKLVRLRYEMPLGEARRFVDELTGRSQAA